MKVLHTLQSLRPETGGPARSVPGLASALKAAGVEVYLWAGERDSDPRTLRGVELLTCSRECLLSNLTKFDLIHDHGLWLPLNHALARAAVAARKPRVVSPRGMLEPWALNHKKWKKRMAWWLYQRRDLLTAAALHATAESEAEQFRKLGLSNPIHVIPNGVDLPLTAFRGENVEGQRSEGGPRTTDDGQRTALFLSRIHPKKGLPLLIEAWAKVKPVGWRMRVVGPDENGHRAELEALVAKAGLRDVWEFSGALEGSEKSAAFDEADLFILPTYSENFGIAVAEALAAGVPVITTTGAPWQGLEREKAGWWVEPTVDALANALQRACSTDASTLHEMGARGREWVAREFSWERIAKQMIKSYETILHEHR